ncbi:predicted protein [Histoplasma mississippiense (nom. inval.)]|nr:predicted protein [Histoplasma mississippiense (nom. inval.)]EDN07052.1 predicted protein [Histoplasma mississippiense (nom. inval.)]
MDSTYVKPEPQETHGISPAIPSFAEKFAARFNELKQEQSISMPSAIDTVASRASGTTDVVDGTLWTGQTPSVSSSALEDTPGHVDPPLTPQPPADNSVSKRKRPTVDPCKCTCAVSRDCPRAARDGVLDCRIAPGLPISKRKNKRTGPKPARESQTFRYISMKERGRLQRSADDVLSLLTLFKSASIAPEIERPGIFKRMRGRVQQLQFYDIDTALPSVLEKFMDPTTGLPAIVHSPNSAVPWDIKSPRSATARTVR